jgi:adenosylhomocysteine nucleosidase
MTCKVLILAALQDELGGPFPFGNVDVVFSGVGKINAAVAASEAIQRLRPSMVVNYGTAGKISPSLNGLIEIASVVQRDMITEPLAPRGTTPYSTLPVILKSGHGSATCGTGDSFVTTADPWLAENGIDLVDMELFAIAHVCQRHDVPWRAFKFITDDANDFSAQEWTANVASGEHLFWHALKAILPPQ